MATYNESGSGGAIGGGVAFLPDPVVVYTDFTRVDLLKYKLSFRSQRIPPVMFRVFVEGSFFTNVDSTDGTGSVNLTIGIGETPFVEVLDHPDMIPHPAFPGDLLLSWRQIQGAEAYAVQIWTGSSWTTLRTMLDNPDTENYSYLTAWLDDEATYQFQVVPSDAAGAAGSPIAHTFEQVRHPDVPKVTYQYNGASLKTVTIS